MTNTTPDTTLDGKKALNLWLAYARKFPPIAKACVLVPEPSLGLESIGGLDLAKEEIEVYACTATHPEVYGRWGTLPPTGLLLMGPAGSGKTLLAEALATLAGTPFLAVAVPRLLLQLLNAPQGAGPLLEEWAKTLSEMPRSVVFFSDLDSPLARPLGSDRASPVAAAAFELLLELVERTISEPHMLAVGSSSQPDSLPRIFIEPGRFERLVDVVPELPDDIIAAVEIHAKGAEKRAGRRLFADIDWKSVVGDGTGISIGEWVRNLHGALRKKARCDAAGEEVDRVTAEDLRAQLERFMGARERLPKAPGSYL